MSNLLVDTNVVSYTFKHDSRHVRYRPHLANNFLAISFMTLAELDAWADINNWGLRKREELATFLSTYIVVESDRELCRAWASIRHQAQRQGRFIETSDAWIAATALLYQIPLVSHNRKHFDWITGLQLISES
jgi:tRNA(fMet)-specific endonuclease VapC